MKLERQFNLSAWNGAAADIACDYLRRRGFRNSQVDKSDGIAVVGSRGSLLGNLTSFDMRKLIARIRVAGDTTGHVAVTLDINTVGQQITEWNAAFWRLELLELASVLQGRGPIPDVWQRYSPARRGHGVRWTFSFMLAGQRLTDALQSEIRQLEETTFATGSA